MRREKSTAGVDQGNRVADKLARKIALTIEQVQLSFASRMNEGFEKMGPKKGKWMITLFALTCSGYSLFLVGQALISARPEGKFSIEQIKRPTNLDKTGSEAVEGSEVDEESFRNVQQYQLFFDSLERHNRPIFDSLVSARPGLFDSIRLLQQIYSSKQNKGYEK